MYYETWEQLKTRPLFPMARAGGPATSRIAADRIALSGVVGNHYRRILEALQIGPAGASEIGRRADMEVVQVSRRTSEMRRLGLVELTGRKALNDKGGSEGEYRTAGRGG